MIQRAVVTGSASGIGRASCERLVARGLHVVGVDRLPSPAASEQVLADLSTAEGVRQAAEQIGPSPLGVICNIAGLPGTRPAAEVLSVNALATRHLTESLLPRLVDGAMIVNLASLAGSNWRLREEEVREFLSFADWDAALSWALDRETLSNDSYRFSKEVVIVWTKMLASDLAARRIRVNSLSPGPVATGILPDFRESLGGERIDRAIQVTGGPASAGAIADVVAFLTSAEASWINGVDIVADGGLSAHRFSGRAPQ